MPELVSKLSQKQCKVRIRRGPHPHVEQPARPWAQRFKEYALLAAIVYRNNDVQPATGWTRAPDTLDDPKTSLYFEVWEKILPGTVEVAVVFRGTHEAKDWWSNARWITRFIPIG